VNDLLPLKQTVEPEDTASIVDAVRTCRGSATPLYPIGGGASLDYGLPAKQPGVGLSLAKMNRVIDHPARDMTITVEAGMTMESLAKTLAGESQQLPLDVPRAGQATIGGVVATGWCGARRLGMGCPRDYVIGISAVDGLGRVFKGGGRVVKNVAGYDFCKLLTGSLGTLAVITQLTLKLKPASERSALVACRVATLEEADRMLAELVTTKTAPVAAELLAGPAWNEDALLGNADRAPFSIVVGFEGTATEVAWQIQELSMEWLRLGIAEPRTIENAPAAELSRRLTEFSALPGSALVLKANVKPSGVTRMIQAFLKTDPQCSIQSHAASGVVIARFETFPKTGLSRTLIGELQPAAAEFGGHIVLLANPSGAEMTRQAVWGSSPSLPLMAAVKREFDPDDVLNRGRFVFA
jgi:glycolate oxidase FAD binding subunit